MAIPSILILLGIIIFTLMMIYKENNAWTSSVISLIGVIVLVPIICALVKETKHDKEISKWLTDELLIKTTAKPWEYDSNIRNFAVSYRFGIDLNINGDLLKKVSLSYDAFYKRIKDTELEILYSPKYDEVMVIQDK